MIAVLHMIKHRLNIRIIVFVLGCLSIELLAQNSSLIIDKPESLLNVVEYEIDPTISDSSLELADKFRKDNNLPDDFPAVIILNKNKPSSGLYFLSSRFFGPPTAGTNYMFCIDTCGTPVYYQALNNRGTDFRVQPNGYLTHFKGEDGYYTQYDSSYNKMREYTAGDGFITDNHELLIEDDGSYWVFTKITHQIDMSIIVTGGDPNATVQENIIQHLTATGEVLFQWNSLDHIAVTDCNPAFVDLTAPYLDYIHINALDFHEDGNLLLSSRHLDEITKIDINTGNIIWRWGGSQNQFTFINDNEGFYGQHSIRYHGDGVFTLFDNGNWHTPQRSRGLEYVLDEVNMTATLVKEYTTSDSLGFNDAMGHMQRTEDGGTLIGWAANTRGVVLTDYNNIGERTLDMFNIDTNLISYRAYKYNWETSIFHFIDDTVMFNDNIIPGDSVTSVATMYNNSENEIELSGYNTVSDAFYVEDNFPVNIPPNSHHDFTIVFKPVNEIYYTDALTIYSSQNFDSTRIAAQTRLLCGLVTSVPENNEYHESLSIVPNPMVTQTKITTRNNDIIISIRIIDNSGRLIYHQNNINKQSIVLNKSMLPAGLFHINVSTDNGYLRGKLQVSF